MRGEAREWAKLWSAREVVASYLMDATGGKIVVAEVVSNLAQLAECMRDAEAFNEGVTVLSEFTTTSSDILGPSQCIPPFMFLLSGRRRRGDRPWMSVLRERPN